MSAIPQNPTAPRVVAGAATSVPATAAAADRTAADALRAAVAESTTRSTVLVGLATLIVIHAIDGVDKWSEANYIFWMYMGAIAASVACGAVLMLAQSRETVRRALLAAAGIAGSVFLGYVISRTTGMPNATDDIGNWTEPLGLASIVSEGLTVIAALAGWRAMRSQA